MGSTTTISPSASKVFTPIKIGQHELSHRLVMAPMTRNRALPTPESSPSNPPQVYLPTNLHQEYYSQRATPGGLIITEGTQISSEAGSMPGVPGLFHPSHVDGWKPVVDAVHGKGAIFFAQLWHAGRHCAPQFTGSKAVSSSSIEWAGEDNYLFPDPLTKAKIKMRENPPLELDNQGIQRVMDEYVNAAKMAVEQCGFDGVEIHAGNGYLIDQFLHDNVNCTRSDEYSGNTVEGRTRFALELIGKLASALGPGRIGLRLEPLGVLYGMKGSQRRETWGHLCSELASQFPSALAYVHFIEPRLDQITSMLSEADQASFWADLSATKDDPTPNPANLSLQPFRQPLSASGIPTISCGGNSGDNAVGGRVDNDEADLVAFARWFLSTPDLVERVRNGHPLNEYDRRTMYGWGSTDETVRRKGYTDYPTWDQVEAAKAS